jgi:hypothetical protein
MGGGGRLGFWLKVVAVNLALILVVLAAFELMFGAWVRAPGLWTLSIQRDVSIYRWEVDKYLRERPLKYSRDYYGLRGNSHPPSALNMVAVGGSTTDEPDVSDEETWVAQLENCLNENGVPARIGNAGINGQSTLGHIRNFEVWLNRIPDLRPKFVLAYVGVNEPKVEIDPNDNIFNDDVTFRDRDGEPNRRYGAGSAERYTLTKVVTDWVVANSALYSLYRIVAGNVAAIRSGSNPRWRTELYYGGPGRGVFWEHEKQTFTETDAALITKALADSANASIDRVVASGKTGAMQINDFFSAEPPQVALSDARIAILRGGFDVAHADKLAAYRARLARLAGAIRDIGAEPILITQPRASYRIDGGMVAGSLEGFIAADGYNRVLLAFCAAERLRCIDLAGELAFGDFDFWDWEHTTPEGSQKIGRHLCGELLGRRIVGPATFQAAATR